MARRQLLFLCGLMCDARVWTPQRLALGSEFDILPINFLGLDSLGDMAEKALAMAGPSFALAGHSMGGRVAMEVFRRAPERIERLALLDTGVHACMEGEVAGRRKLVEIGYSEGMKAVADAWLPPMVAPAHRDDAALMGNLVDMICNTTPEVFERQQHALITRPDATPLLTQIRVPTLVATGRYDDFSPVSQHDDIARQIPGAELSVFEDSGHMCSLETPEAVNAALLRWMRG
jgi:pimeloyl-ACP methyl ester carboxylesterase